mgnify:CR=1 FL=1
MPSKSLNGVRVLELGQMVAAPSASRILADFGADVIKVEPLSGDPLRHWGQLAPSGDSWWWAMQARNKRLVAVNLHTAEGQQIVRDLVPHVDVVIANLRPGRLEQWRLGYEALSEIHPGLIYVSISGFGATGPYRERAGFGNIAEAMGGIRYITGYPDRPPVRTGVSLGDELAALYAVIGTLMALYRRQNDPQGRGDFVDVALTESVMAITEALIPEYVNAGIIQERTGNQLLRAAPSNTYPTRDRKWIAIGANSQGTFTALAGLMGRADLVDDPRFLTNTDRVRHADILDDLIATWTIQHDLADLLRWLEESGVPAGPVMNAKDIVEDPQVKARGFIRFVPGPGGQSVGMGGIVPRMQQGEGAIRWAGGAVGSHTTEVLTELLGVDSAQIERWRQNGIVT